MDGSAGEGREIAARVVIRFLLRRLRESAIGGLAFSSVALAGAPEPTLAPSRHSFLEPVTDFLRDDVIRPIAPFPMVPGKDPNGWSFVVEPYVWSLALGGDIGVKGMPALHLDMTSRSILQNLDWGVFARGEVRKGRWGLLADGYYAALSGNTTIENRIYDGVNLNVQQSLVSAALAYRLIDDRRGFLDVYAGARYNFLGLQADASLNDSRINDLASRATEAVSQRISDQIQSALQTLLPQLQVRLESELADAVDARLADQALDKRALTRELLTHRDLRQLVRDRVIRESLVKGKVREAMADYLRAAVQARVAAAKNRLDARLESAAASAKQKLNQAIAARLQEATPTYSTGSQWWVDPIIGLRGQINVTRWLFVASQADVGGFGAGSQIAWNVQATLGVNFTRNVFGELGYRYYYVDYTNGGFVYDMNSAGIFSGIGVRF